MKVQVVGRDASKQKDHVNGVGKKGFAVDWVGQEMGVMERQEVQTAMYVPKKVIMAVKYIFAF